MRLISSSLLAWWFTSIFSLISFRWKSSHWLSHFPPSTIPMQAGIREYHICKDPICFPSLVPITFIFLWSDQTEGHVFLVNWGCGALLSAAEGETTRGTQQWMPLKAQVQWNPIHSGSMMHCPTLGIHISSTGTCGQYAQSRRRRKNGSGEPNPELLLLLCSWKCDDNGDKKAQEWLKIINDKCSSA